MDSATGSTSRPTRGRRSSRRRPTRYSRSQDGIRCSTSRSSSNESRSRTSISLRGASIRTSTFIRASFTRRWAFRSRCFRCSSIPRTSGWIAQWEEMLLDPEQKIARPRRVHRRGARDYVSEQARLAGCEPHFLSRVRGSGQRVAPTRRKRSRRQAWQDRTNGGIAPTNESQIAPTPVFDSKRAWEHLRKQVSIGPRPSGTPAIVETRNTSSSSSRRLASKRRSSRSSG